MITTQGVAFWAANVALDFGLTYLMREDSSKKEYLELINALKNRVRDSLKNAEGGTPLPLVYGGAILPVQIIESHVLNFSKALLRRNPFATYGEGGANQEELLKELEETFRYDDCFGLLYYKNDGARAPAGTERFKEGFISLGTDIGQPPYVSTVSQFGLLCVANGTDMKAVYLDSELEHGESLFGSVESSKQLRCAWRAYRVSRTSINGLYDFEGVQSKTPTILTGVSANPALNGQYRWSDGQLGDDEEVVISEEAASKRKLCCVFYPEGSESTDLNPKKIHPFNREDLIKYESPLPMTLKEDDFIIGKYKYGNLNWASSVNLYGHFHVASNADDLAIPQAHVEVECGGDGSAPMLGLVTVERFHHPYIVSAQGSPTGAIYPTQTKAANPAFVIYDLLSRAGYSENLDDTSFVDAAIILTDEGFGIDVVIEGDTDILRLLQDIVSAIEGVVYVENGFFKLKLFRPGDSVTPLNGIDIVDIADISSVAPSQAYYGVFIEYKPKLGLGSASMRYDSISKDPSKTNILELKYPFITTDKVAKKALELKFKSMLGRLFRLDVTVTTTFAQTLSIGSVISLDSDPLFDYASDIGSEVNFRILSIEHNPESEGTSRLVGVSDNWSIDASLSYFTNTQATDPSNVTQPCQGEFFELPDYFKFDPLPPTLADTTIDNFIPLLDDGVTEFSPTVGGYTDTYVQCVPRIYFEPASKTATILTLNGKVFVFIGQALMHRTISGDEIIVVKEVNGLSVLVERGMLDTTPRDIVDGDYFFEFTSGVRRTISHSFSDYYSFKSYFKGARFVGPSVVESSTSEFSWASPAPLTPPEITKLGGVHKLGGPRFMRVASPKGVTINSSYFPVGVSGDMTISWRLHDIYTNPDRGFFYNYTTTSGLLHPYINTLVHKTLVLVYRTRGPVAKGPFATSLDSGVNTLTITDAIESASFGSVRQDGDVYTIKLVCCAYDATGSSNLAQQIGGGVPGFYAHSQNPFEVVVTRGATESTEGWGISWGGYWG